MAGDLSVPESTLRWARVRASVEARFVGLVVSATDMLPAEIRYGHLRSITQRLFGRTPLPHITGAREAPAIPSASITSAGTGPRVTLVTGRLDVGGLENVVRMLAEGLGAEGLVTSVLCTGGGVTFDALAAAGVDVVAARTPAEARAELNRLRPDVIEVHNAPQHLLDSVQESGVPWVSVIHNAEIHRTSAGWAEVAQTRATRWIAVSEGVREFHLAHLPRDAPSNVVVVPNASPAAPFTYDPAQRSWSRRALEEATGWRVRDEHVVVVSLSRYDSQKNIPGLVACFGDAAAARSSLRIVVAGPTTDWLEVVRADAIRRASASPQAMALLGPSPSHVLLAAADVFVLDSFFEGWPIAVIEAVQAGLPIILSDVGVAGELLRDGTRGTLVPNPATGATIDEKAVSAARRRVRSQRNAAAVRGALIDMADHVAEWRTARSALAASAAELFTLDEMIRGHAYWLKDALKASTRS
jgi:glycosyltransferase involved in cell wall biosynthesis